MNEIFGVSMDYIAGVCIALTIAILLFIALIAWRNPVMFKMGLRNIPRRKAQTALIVIGLMLSTVIMSAAFGTGDTLTRSVTNEVYSIAGEADEIIIWNVDDHPVPESDRVLPIAEIDSWAAQFDGDPDIAGIIPYRTAALPAQNVDTRLNESSATFMGIREPDYAALGGLKDTSGGDVVVGPGEVGVNEELQEALDASVGDTIRVFYGEDEYDLVVVAILPDSVLSGAFDTFALQGGVINFEELGEMTGRGDTADGALVSNVGDTRSGLARSDAAVDKIEPLLDDSTYEILAFKKDSIEFAELLGALFLTFFVVFGLFSIAAGVLLIFLIFVMLAAERKPEMGMARAVGAKRRQLVESFLAEGMGYDLGSALVGLVVGMGVTVLMVEIIKAFAGDALGLDLTVAFTIRSLVTSFCIGVIATFLVIFIASWRASRLNITAAIRDLPDTKPVNPETSTWKGYYRAVLNGVVAMALPLGLAFMFAGGAGVAIGSLFIITGLFSPWFYALRGSNFAAPASVRTDEGPPSWPWILGLALPVIGWIGILPFYFLTLLFVRSGRDRKPASLTGWMPAVGFVFPPFGFVVALLQDHKAQIIWSVGMASAFGIAGVALTYTCLL
ncbi:MAG: ABC transporter permease [Tepidiformaceae bacterium]